MKKLSLLLALLLVPIVLAAPGYDNPQSEYVKGTDITSLYNCIRFSVDNESREVRVKATVDVDGEYLENTRRDCWRGHTDQLMYYRNIHLLDDRISFDSDYYGYPGELDEVLLSNWAVWGEVFEPLNEDYFYESTSSVRIRDDVLGGDSIRNQINKFINYDYRAFRVVDTSIVDLSEWWFYYALAVDANDDSNFLFTDVTRTTYSPTQWDDLGHGYDVGDLTRQNDFLEGSLGLYLDGGFLRFEAPNTAACYNRGLRFCGPLAFTDDLNWYYYPYYIKGVDIVVRGYPSDDNLTRVFTYNEFLEPTSNVVVVDSGLFGSGGTTPTLVYDVPELWTQLRYDDVITTLPDDVGFVNISYTVLFGRSEYYRHDSPVDTMWYHNDLFFSDLPEGDSYFRNLRLVQSNITYNVSIDRYGGLPGDTNPDNNSGLSDSDTSGSNTTDYVVGEDVGGNGTAIPWAGDIGEGGSLTNMRAYANAISELENKGNFFGALLIIEGVIIDLFLVFYLLLSVVVAIYSFFLMIPSAYRKTLKEFRRLINFG